MEYVRWREIDVILALIRAGGWHLNEFAAMLAPPMNANVIYRLDRGVTKEPKERTLERLASGFHLSLIELRQLVPRQPIGLPNGLRMSPRAIARREAAEHIRRASRPRPSRARIRKAK